MPLRARIFVSIAVLCALVAAQAPGPQLLIVPAQGHPERAASLAATGHLIGWGEAFLVLPDSAGAVAAVQAKGLPLFAVPDAPAGSHLFLVRGLDPGDLGALAATATILHQTGGESLVWTPVGGEESLLSWAKPNHKGIVRISRDALRPVVERDWFAHTGRGLVDTVTPNPQIQALIAQVSQTNLQATVTSLSSLFNRRSDAPGGVQAQNQVFAAFQAIPGLTVTTHDFDSGSDNVIAELPGVVDPTKILVIGAHYDSTAGGASAPAPGADDNASGSASVLEMARILANYPMKYTVRFCLFAAEEVGLVGSAAYAQMMVNQGQNVFAMLNNDMNAYRAPSDPQDFVLINNYSSPALNAFTLQIAAAYVPSLPGSNASFSYGSSDHQSFFTRGIPAIFPFEDVPNYSPYIHSANDVIGVSAVDFDLSAKMTRIVLALAAELAVPAELTVSHVPVTGTTDTQGPYPVLATVSSLSSTPLSTVTLSGTDSGGPFSVAMVPTVTPGEWIADLPGQPEGTTVSYAIEAVDTLGNIGRYPETGPSGAGAVSFKVGSVIAFWFDDFESGAPGWTHGTIGPQDDWQLGTPQGNAGDPGAAYSGSSVWANDLGMSGWNGSYATNTNNWLRSPFIDCSGQTGVHLALQRWLTVEDGVYDQARIKVNGTQVWVNPAGTGDLIDTSWQEIDLDISALADNNPAVQIEFSMQADGGVNFGGWNIDDVALTVAGPPSHRSLVADRSYFSHATAPPVALTLDFGATFAGRSYLMLPGVSGSSPGLTYGPLTIPLNPDFVTETVALYFVNTPLFANFAGSLDTTGQAIATMAIPSSASLPSLAGVTFTLAAITTVPTDAASNHVDVLVVP